MIGRLFGRGAPTPTRAVQRHDRIAPALGLDVARLRPAGEAFTPTRPRPGRRSLVGREAELERILQALREEGAHVVLYSERGRGKTSLGNLVIEALRRSGTIVGRHTCDSASSFESVMRGLAADLPGSLLTSHRGAPGEGCEAALPATNLVPRDVVALMSNLSCRSVVFVIDEFDRIVDDNAKIQLADTIKQVSDRSVGLAFMIVGVAETLEQIIGQHPSIQRNIVPVHLPLLTDGEIANLLAKGGREAGVAFPPDVIAQISVVARGMPYMAQLLGLRVVQAAIARGDGTATDGDLVAALTRVVADERANVVALYGRLVSGERDTEMLATLRRIVTADQDGWGRLRLVRDRERATVGGRAVDAACLHRLEAEGVIRHCEQGLDLVVFEPRSLMYYVLLRAALAGRDEPPALRLGPETVRRRAQGVAMQRIPSE